MSYSSWQLLKGNPYSGWEIKKFAQKLKEIASILTGISVDKFEDQEFKRQPLDRSWTYPIQLHGEERWVEMTVREFLQRLGTNSIRNNLHSNTWVNALFSDYLKYPKWDNSEFKDVYPNWVITDVRFPNEYEAIKLRGGIIIRKFGAEEFSSAIQNLHESETALDNYEADHELHYCEDIETLIEQIKEILIKKEIL